ncbi:MAG TPA: Fe-S metabolism protein SufE [Flavobacteriales bacterium]|jgi:cysteine desulfuration protein SufE|nr:SufE family protein [Flavobacteriales bacterium]HAW19433.1 Fe-S metabolism protein SufE [Flavobacteriales bacterium]
MTIDQTQNEIIEEFEFFDEWIEKYEHIISFSKDLEPMADDYKTEDNLVKGCQSRVWLDAELIDDKLIFKADSDAVITRGLVALMVRVLSGHRPAEIAAVDLFFIEKIGLKEHLSPNRSNGLLSMIKKMKLYALAYQAKLNEE